MRLMLFMTLFLIGGKLYAEAPKKPPESTPQLIEIGTKAFQINCMNCHGKKGDGKGPGSAALNPKPRDFTKGQFKKGNTPEVLFKTISNGLPGTPMAPWGHLKEEQRWGLVYYILSLRKK